MTIFDMETATAEYTKDFAEIFRICPPRISAINVYRDTAGTLLYSFHEEHGPAEYELQRLAPSFDCGVTFARQLTATLTDWIVADAFDSELGV